jgi:hypothetical protein
MKYCPNADCSYAKKFSRPGEYQDTASTCSDCGATLIATPPAVVKPAVVEAPRVVKPSDANSRLAVTVGAGAALGVLAWLPLFGAPESIFGGNSEEPLNMLEVGMTPFMTAFTLTELLALMLPPLRAVRVGGSQARATLDRVSWALGGLFLVAQLLGVVGAAREMGVALPPAPLLWAQLTGAHLTMLGLAVVVSRAGLGNGFGLVMVMTFVLALVENAETVLLAVQTDSLSLGPVLLFGGLIIYVAARGTRFARESRGHAGPLPTAVPFPVSGAVAWLNAGAVMSVPATLGPWGGIELQRALQSSSTLYGLLYAFIAFDLSLAFGFLFFRPRAIGAIWKRWIPGVDETGVISAARALLPRAIALAIGLTVGAPMLLMLLGNMVNLWIGGSTVLFALIIGCALADMADEWHALRRLGPLVSVWEVQRTAEVEPIASLLGTAGIEVHARSFLLRTTQQFFAPWIPVSILVPVAREADAKALLAKT